MSSTTSPAAVNSACLLKKYALSPVSLAACTALALYTITTPSATSTSTEIMSAASILIDFIS